MRILALLPATVVLAVCAAAPELDLTAYFSRPPIDRPLADGASLIELYGEGCTRVEPNPPGAPTMTHHAYVNVRKGNWVEASVLSSGPEANDLVGVMVTTVPLCSEARSLKRAFGATGIYGVNLGDRTEKVIELLGEPLRRSEERLGDLPAVMVLEYFPESSNPNFSVRFHVADNLVVAVSILFTE